MLNGERARFFNAIVHPIRPLKLCNTFSQLKPPGSDNPERTGAIFLVFSLFNQHGPANPWKPFVASMVCDGLKDRVNILTKNPLDVNAKHNYSSKTGLTKRNHNAGG